MSGMRKLPGGGFTTSLDAYTSAWQEAVASITKVMGWRLASYDPGFSFETAAREIVYLDQDSAIQLAKVLDRKLIGIESERMGTFVFRGGYVEDEAGDRWWSAGLLAKVEKERDEAIRERDEARAEVQRLAAPKGDLLGALKELERREIHRLKYNQAWEQAILDGKTREEAHKIAGEASYEWRKKD